MNHAKHDHACGDFYLKLSAANVFTGISVPLGYEGIVGSGNNHLDEICDHDDVNGVKREYLYLLDVQRRGAKKHHQLMKVGDAVIEKNGYQTEVKWNEYPTNVE